MNNADWFIKHWVCMLHEVLSGISVQSVGKVALGISLSTRFKYAWSDRADD